MLGRRALLLSLITFGCSLGAAGVCAAPVKTKLAVKNVRQKDGSVMARLELPAPALSVKKGHSSAALPQNLAEVEQAQPSRKIDLWLDAVTEARAMTALAAIPVDPGAEAKGLAQNIDPTKVRNWTEFVDPDLYLRWLASGADSRFGQAIHNRTPMSNPRWMAFPIKFPVPLEFQPGVPLKPSLWSHAMEPGSAGGEAAAQEWLKLPSADPKTNPWLKAGQNYRY